MSAASLAAVLDPSAVAIVGASDNPHKVGGRPLHYLSKFGFKGRIYPINPTRDVVQGFRSYPDLASLPEAPDLAIIATPGELVTAAVGQCADRGVRATIVISSGFGETADADAIAAERALVQRARAAGMRLIGPNTQGLANFGTGTVASFSTMFMETTPLDGPIGIISQSGIMSTLPYGLLRARGFGVRHSHATGNEADVTLAELAEAVVQDPEIRLLLLYIESLRNAEALARAAAIARERDVPIVAVKSGRTARGQQAARSHTGALASEDRVVEAFFARHGIWRVNDIHELVSGVELYLKGWRPKNRSLVFISNSGASCVMAADASEALGLELATLPDATVRTLAGHLPSFATVTNPIDVTAALLTDSALFGRVLDAVAEGSDAELLLAAIPVAGVGYDVDMFARDAAAFMRRTGKAIAVAVSQDAVGAPFRSAGVPTFDNQTEAMAALAQIARHAERLRDAPCEPRHGRRVPVPAGSGPFVDEANSLDLLAAAGLPAVPYRRCRTAEAAISAAAAFGGAIVVKACAEAVPHKSEHQLVALDVEGRDAVGAAFARLTEKLAAMGVEGDILVAPMIRGRFEAMLGARVDPLFGPVVMIGEGGKYVEVFQDVQLLLPPFTIDDARSAARRLRMAPLFEGVRGEPALDLDALCDAAVTLGDMILANRDRIASVDLNPVMVLERGRGVVIVDALVERNADGH
jgi:acetate---CoA ligase (ADP-forming)